MLAIRAYLLVDFQVNAGSSLTPERSTPLRKEETEKASRTYLARSAFGECAPASPSCCRNSNATRGGEQVHDLQWNGGAGVQTADTRHCESLEALVDDVAHLGLEAHSVGRRVLVGEDAHELVRLDASDQKLRGKSFVGSPWAGRPA